MHTSSNSTLSSLAAERELFFLGVLAMEMAMELEDDLFFADLSKQISLLIMDDDDEDPSVSFQVLHHTQPLISCKTVSSTFVA